MPSERCPLCLTGYSATCPLCRERTTRMTPLKIIGTFPWSNHSLVWDDPTMGGMHCELCGKVIIPEMTMRELVGPCSGRVEARV